MEKKDEGLEIIYKVMGVYYDWDNQSSDFYFIDETRNYEESMRIKEISSGEAFVIKTLEKNNLYISDSGNDKIPEHGEMRPLLPEEIEFIKTINIKLYKPSTFKIGNGLEEVFGKDRTPSSYEQYYGPSNWYGIEEINEKNILIVYDLETGQAMTTSEKILKEKENIATIDIAQLGAKIGMEEKER